MDFSTPLTTLDAAQAFIRDLHANDMMFHFEDSPETIINGNTGRALFTAAEAAQIRARMVDLYSFDWTEIGHECPIGYALEVGDPEQYKPTEATLCEEYNSYLDYYHLPKVSAEELIHGELPPPVRVWISTFIRRWEAVV